MKPQHTPEQLDALLDAFAAGERRSLAFDEIESLRHYLAKYRLLADVVSLLADGTFAAPRAVVWHRGDGFCVGDIPYIAWRQRADGVWETVATHRCHRTREASMEAEQCK